jgi:hypothetical protein
MFGGIESVTVWRRGLAVSYNAKKWSCYISGDYRRYDFDGHRIGRVRTIYQDTTSYLPSEGIRDFRDQQYSARAGSTVTLGKGNSLNSSGFTMEAGKTTVRPISIIRITIKREVRVAFLTIPGPHRRILSIIRIFSFAGDFLYYQSHLCT